MVAGFERGSIFLSFLLSRRRGEGKDCEDQKFLIIRTFFPLRTTFTHAYAIPEEKPFYFAYTSYIKCNYIAFNSRHRYQFTILQFDSLACHAVKRQNEGEQVIPYC